MKNAKPKLGLMVAAALLGMGHAAHAQMPIIPKDGEFTPLERLSTDERARYEQLIRYMERTMRIDWESVTLGVDENGNLVLRGRNSVGLESVSEPSCWTAPY